MPDLNLQTFMFSYMHDKKSLLQGINRFARSESTVRSVHEFSQKIDALFTRKIEVNGKTELVEHDPHNLRPVLEEDLFKIVTHDIDLAKALEDAKTHSFSKNIKVYNRYCSFLKKAFSYLEANKSALQDAGRVWWCDGIPQRRTLQILGGKTHVQTKPEEKKQSDVQSFYEFSWSREVQQFIHFCIRDGEQTKESKGNEDKEWGVLELRFNKWIEHASWLRKDRLDKSKSRIERKLNLIIEKYNQLFARATTAESEIFKWLHQKRLIVQFMINGNNDEALGKLKADFLATVTDKNKHKQYGNAFGKLSSILEMVLRRIGIEEKLKMLVHQHDILFAKYPKEKAMFCWLLKQGFLMRFVINKDKDARNKLLAGFLETIPSKAEHEKYVVEFQRLNSSIDLFLQQLSLLFHNKEFYVTHYAEFAREWHGVESYERVYQLFSDKKVTFLVLQSLRQPHRFNSWLLSLKESKDETTQKLYVELWAFMQKFNFQFVKKNKSNADVWVGSEKGVKKYRPWVTFLVEDTIKPLKSMFNDFVVNAEDEQDPNRKNLKKYLFQNPRITQFLLAHEEILRAAAEKFSTASEDYHTEAFEVAEESRGIEESKEIFQSSLVDEMLNELRRPQKIQVIDPKTQLSKTHQTYVYLSYLEALANFRAPLSGQFAGQLRKLLEEEKNAEDDFYCAVFGTTKKYGVIWNEYFGLIDVESLNFGDADIFKKFLKKYPKVADYLLNNLQIFYQEAKEWRGIPKELPAIPEEKEDYSAEDEGDDSVLEKKEEASANGLAAKNDESKAPINEFSRPTTISDRLAQSQIPPSQPNLMPSSLQDEGSSLLGSIGSWCDQLLSRIIPG